MNNLGLEAFNQIVKCGSFSKAANEMNISQPALSHRITLLEEELGYPLFLRGKGVRTLHLTEQGEIFLRIVNKIQQLNQQAEDIRNMARRTPFSVSGTESINYILDEAYNIFASENPDIYLTINTLNSDDAYREVLNDNLDIAFINTPDFSKHVTTSPFFGEECRFICAADSSYSRLIHPESDLSARNLVWCRFDEDKYLWYKKWFGDEGYPFMNIRNPATYPTFLSVPERWGICPATMADRMVRNGLVATRELLDGPQDRQAYYLVGKNAPDQIVRRLIEFMKNYILKEFPSIQLLCK